MPKGAREALYYSFYVILKMTPHRIVQNVKPSDKVVICCEADEQWYYV
jgi:insertion element IS1 protein InsB